MILTPHRAVWRRALTPQGTGFFSVQDLGDEDVTSFRCDLTPPDSSNAVAEEGSPRDGDPYTLTYPTSTFTPPDRPRLPGERVEIEGELYELLSLPRKIRTGRRDTGVRVPVMPVATLYPFVGKLQDMGGVSTSGDEDTLLPYAMWSPGDAHTGQGDYRTWLAESPPEWGQDLIIKNRQIEITPDYESDGTTVYRIVDPKVILAAPRVTFTMRGSR